MSSDTKDSNGRGRADMDADLSTDSESSDCDTDKYDRKNRQAGQYSFHNYESNSLRIITVRRKIFKIWQYLSSL